jgi:hypothetical protein
MNDNKRRDYLNVRFTQLGDLYRAADRSYECRICGGAVPTMPTETVSCDCGNILIDVDACRVSIRDFDQTRVFYS